MHEVVKELNRKHYFNSNLIRLSQAQRNADEESGDLEEQKLSADSSEELETKSSSHFRDPERQVTEGSAKGQIIVGVDTEWLQIESEVDAMF